MTAATQSLPLTVTNAHGDVVPNPVVFAIPGDGAHHFSFQCPAPAGTYLYSWYEGAGGSFTFRRVIVHPDGTWANVAAALTPIAAPIDTSRDPVRRAASRTIWYVLKSTIRTRLRSAGLEAKANAAFAKLPPTQQDDWVDALVIHNNDSTVIALLNAIGANAGVILAQDPAAHAMFGGRAS